VIHLNLSHLPNVRSPRPNLPTPARVPDMKVEGTQFSFF
jgi:hypothetical protein